MITAAFKIVRNKYLQYRKQQQCKHEFCYNFSASEANWEETYVCRQCLLEVPEDTIDKYMGEHNGWQHTD